MSVSHKEVSVSHTGVSIQGNDTDEVPQNKKRTLMKCLRIKKRTLMKRLGTRKDTDEMPRHKKRTDEVRRHKKRTLNKERTLMKCLSTMKGHT